MAVLKQLLGIKTFRERKAHTELQRAARALAEATRRLEAEQQALAALRRETREREEALYADLFSRLVLKSDLDDVKLKVEDLRQHLADREAQLDEVAQARQAAFEARDEAIRLHQQAVRQREKFDEIVARAELELAFERQRVEDLELEEVRVAGPGGADEAADAAEVSA